MWQIKCARLCASSHFICWLWRHALRTRIETKMVVVAWVDIDIFNKIPMRAHHFATFYLLTVHTGKSICSKADMPAFGIFPLSKKNLSKCFVQTGTFHVANEMWQMKFARNWSKSALRKGSRFSRVGESRNASSNVAILIAQSFKKAGSLCGSWISENILF